MKTPTLTLRTHFTEILMIIHPWSTSADTCWCVNRPCDRCSLFGASVWSAFCHCIRKHSPVVDVVDDTAIEVKLTQADPRKEEKSPVYVVSSWTIHQSYFQKNSRTSKREFIPHSLSLTLPVKVALTAPVAAVASPLPLHWSLCSCVNCFFHLCNVTLEDVHKPHTELTEAAWQASSVHILIVNSKYISSLRL